MMHDETAPRLAVRLPQDVKEWLANEAARNCASLNGEIVRTLRMRMDSEPKRATG